MKALSALARKSMMSEKMSIGRLEVGFAVWKMNRLLDPIKYRHKVQVKGSRTRVQPFGRGNCPPICRETSLSAEDILITIIIIRIITIRRIIIMIIIIIIRALIIRALIFVKAV